MHLVPVKAKVGAAARGKGQSGPRSKVGVKSTGSGRVIQADGPRAASAFAAMAPTGEKPVEGQAKGSGRLDHVVYSLVRSGNQLFAGSAGGLLRSTDGGQHWALVSSLAMPEVHFVASLSGSGSRRTQAGHGRR